MKLIFMRVNIYANIYTYDYPCNRRDNDRKKLQTFRVAFGILLEAFGCFAIVTSVIVIGTISRLIFGDK